MKDSIGYAGETPEWRAAYDAAIEELDWEFPAASAAVAIIAEKFRVKPYLFSSAPTGSTGTR